MYRNLLCKYEQEDAGLHSVLYFTKPDQESGLRILHKAAKNTDKKEVNMFMIAKLFYTKHGEKTASWK